MAGVIFAGHTWLQIAADLRAADSRFSDDRGHDVLSGRERGRDGLVDHHAARASVWPDQRDWRR